MYSLFIGFLSLVVGVSFLVYLQVVPKKKRERKLYMSYSEEFRKFVENMGENGLDIKGNTISKMLGKYKTLSELKEANKKLEKAIKDYKLS